jgi:hypothetical protein
MVGKERTTVNGHSRSTGWTRVANTIVDGDPPLDPFEDSHEQEGACASFDTF